MFMLIAGKALKQPEPVKISPTWPFKPVQSLDCNNADIFDSHLRLAATASLNDLPE